MIKAPLSFSRTAMLRLLLLRSLTMLSVLGVALWVYFPSASQMQHRGLIALCLLAIALAAAQAVVIWRRWSVGLQLLCQFGADVLLVSLLVLLTGGIHSPFILIFGLLIVANGLHSHTLSVVLVSIAACLGYLIAIHAYAWMQSEHLPDESTLKILLQVSILLLVGGIMAAIANRHASLARQSDQVVLQHQNLQRMHHQVMASMSEGMVVLDQKLNIQDYNEAAHRIFSGQATIGMNIRQVSILPTLILRYLQSSDSQQTFQCEWTFQAQVYLIQVNKLPENGQLACWLLSFIELTAMKQLEAELREKNKLAALGRMAAMLAHELRNPMHTMSQAIDLMAKVKDEQRDAVHAIVHEEIQRLDRLIEDMLNYTRPLQPNPENIDLGLLLQDSLMQVDPVGQHQIQFTSHPLEIYEDPGHLRLVIDNLLRNALQASPQIASVRVEFAAYGADWYIEVIDAGRGIDPAIEKKLFEPFVSYRDGGTGLGLATVWQVCQVNHWHISHHRKQGETCFRVEKKQPDHESQPMIQQEMV